MHRTLPSLFIALAAVAALPAAQTFAQDTAAAPAVADFKPIVDHIDLKDGDTLVFLGDSITHQCLYTQYVEDYFYTRYPKTRIHFHNAGVGGDRASNALARFDEDVASFKPKYVTILLGMNDGAYKGFDQAVFDTYQRDMGTVLDRIAQLGAVAVPMTPTMHDGREARVIKRALEPRDTYYNGVLALYGAWLREQAQVHGLGFVDMWSPLNRLSLEQRKKDATWTMIKDAVHPGPTGQVVMAESILDDMVAHSNVSGVTIGLEQGQLTAHASHGIAGDVRKLDKGVAFSFAAKALPWILPPDTAEGVKLTHAGHRFSNEKVTVRDLAPGKYSLKIDGQVVGSYDEGQLAAGVELEENEKTPQYQQALKVALLNKERNEKAMHPLRDQWATLKGKRNDLNKAEQANSPELETKKAAFDTWYANFHTTVDGLKTKVQEYEDQIYQINQPAAHQYEVVSE